MMIMIVVLGTILTMNLYQDSGYDDSRLGMEVGFS